MVIRTIQLSDISECERLYCQMDTESIFMAFEQEDREFWAKDVHGYIQSALDNSQSHIWVLEQAGRLHEFL